MALSPNEVKVHTLNSKAVDELEELVDNKLKEIVVDPANPEVRLVVVGDYDPNVVQVVARRFVDAGWTAARFKHHQQRHPEGNRSVEIYLGVLPKTPER